MNNLSSTTIEGFITQDPIIRKTKNNKDVCSFSVAMKHYSSGDDDAKVSFFDVESWDKLAMFCSEILKKGKRVLVSGSLKQDRWVDADGKNRSKIILVASQIRLLSSDDYGTKKETKAA